MLAASALVAMTLVAFGSSPSPQRSSTLYSFLQSGLPRHSTGAGRASAIVDAGGAASTRGVPLGVRKYPRAAKARKEAAALDSTTALLLPSVDDPAALIELDPVATEEALEGSFLRPKDFWVMTKAHGCECCGNPIPVQLILG
jgi:hypothetical protein